MEFLKMNTTRKKLRLSVIFFSLFITFIFLFFFAAGPHFMNNNRFENARRLVCKANLKKIQKRLINDNVELTEENMEKIENVMKEYNFHCPSGLKIHKNKKDSEYYIFVDVNRHIIIKENKSNHDSCNFAFTDLPYENYFLYQNKDGIITIGIETTSLSSGANSN